MVSSNVLDGEKYDTTLLFYSAQKAGFLSEAHHEEADQADPFYAHCKVHSDKTLIKHRKRNYNALLLQMKRHDAELELGRKEKPTVEQERIERKLKKHRIKYTSNKLTRIEPWGEFCNRNEKVRLAYDAISSQFRPKKCRD
jgi:hypothetical protein